MDLRGAWNERKRRRSSDFWRGISRCKIIGCKGRAISSLGYCLKCELVLAQADMEMLERIRLAEQR